MSLLQLAFEAPPALAYSVHQEYVAASTPARTPHSNFLRGVKWSPDGACLLTASDDNCLRIYDTPLEAFQLADAAAAAAAADADAPAAAGQRVPAQAPALSLAAAAAGGGGGGDTLAPALRIQEGEALYDWCWFAGMSAADPASCCLASTARGQPVHLWDALTGELRCTYRAYDQMDEVAPAHSLAFSCDGATLFAGFGRGTLRAFAVDRPGRDCRALAEHRKGGEGLAGIVSCLAPNPDRSGMLAAGSYGGSAALLDPRTRELLCLLEGGHAGGVTHLCFSADGNFLYTGGRRDPPICCWDVRYASGVLYTLQRPSATTNQRMAFDVEPCGRHLATGGEDGTVLAFDLRDGSRVAQWAAADDAVNGVSFHPFLPLLAASSGQRRYYLAPSSDSDSEDDSGSGSSSSSGSDSEAGAPPAAAAGAATAAAAAARAAAAPPGGVLSARENVLQVWQCAAVPLEAPPPAADTAQATGTGGDPAAAAGDGAHAADDEPAAEPAAADADMLDGA